ncbi:hypothetical protein QMW88_16060 [Cronobacter dublinensis]|uniref:hypothetical protein n=1 Tax=Cronobacter dublinensis TaxID=413497 RepID=UPI000CFA91AA|nr:hypothetical protein [Cronobacter dublinensis]MDK1193453.1 hypothetical protein [Cronobacter dublinensis]MDK1202762.1 hypothetical protein [Cronobacter dublinensis]
MSISLSLFFKESLNIDVSELIIEASKIFRMLSGQKDTYIHFHVYDSKDNVIKKVKPDVTQVYSIIENNIFFSGGYFLYGPDEHWQYHSEEQLNEFSITEINFEPHCGKFLMFLSILVAVAEFSKSDYLVDTSGILSVTKTDRAKISDILDLKLSSDSADINESCDLLYATIIINKWQSKDQ